MTPFIKTICATKPRKTMNGHRPLRFFFFWLFVLWRCISVGTTIRIKVLSGLAYFHNYRRSSERAFQMYANLWSFDGMCAVLFRNIFRLKIPLVNAHIYKHFSQFIIYLCCVKHNKGSSLRYWPMARLQSALRKGEPNIPNMVPPQTHVHRRTVSLMQLKQ